MELEPCEFLTSRKLFSKATRMLVSILVLFFRLRLSPSMPMPGEPRALGLDRAWSDVRFSAQTVQTQRKGREVKTRHCGDKGERKKKKKRPLPIPPHKSRCDINTGYIMQSEIIISLQPFT